MASVLLAGNVGKQHPGCRDREHTQEPATGAAKRCLRNRFSRISTGTDSLGLAGSARGCGVCGGGVGGKGSSNQNKGLGQQRLRREPAKAEGRIINKLQLNKQKGVKLATWPCVASHVWVLGHPDYTR